MRNWILAAALVAGACGDSGSVADPDAPPPVVTTRVEAMPIESVELRVAESSPPLVFAHVRGILPDACAHLDAIEQRTFGNDVTVVITIRRPNELACIQVVGFYEHDIPLVGPFTSGRYTVRVNGIERTIEL